MRLDRRIVQGVVALSLLSSSSSALQPTKRSYDTHKYYVIEHDPSHGASIHDCANALGLEVVEPAGELEDHWLMRTQNDFAGEDDRILQAYQEMQMQGGLGIAKREAVGAVKRLLPQVARQRVKRAPPPPVPVEDEPEAKPSLARKIAERLGIVDPLFPSQWHLVNDEFPQHSMNATPVWDMGIAGEGVITTLLDDGLEYESSDLADNFYAAGSYDFNDHEPLPKPKLWDDHHGTRCAGQIAAVKNSVCGMGIAYRSKVAGVRILSGSISDVDEAASLNYDYQNASIYSCSWGPTDDGKTMEAPNYLIQKAMVNGVQNGRAGKGSIFVFASGNGAYADDQCNFDGYTNSIYSVTVAAIDYKGQRPYYSEACAANLVVAYSSGTNPKKAIVTTDMGIDKCATSHGGTSAAAPNAAGVLALALSVRPDLTWRDIQHLCVNAAQIINPEDPDWEVTASGRPFSYKYGYGKIDAYHFVTAAQNWSLVKPQAFLELPPVQLGDGKMNVTGEMEGGIPIGPGGVSSNIMITSQMLQDRNFEGLEHVTVKVWISHTKRGDVEVEIISPSGIRSVLAGKRPKDFAETGFPGWRFMTVKHWGENPVGEWTLRVTDQKDPDHHGAVLGWTISLWGSVADPDPSKSYMYALPWDELPFPPPEPTHTSVLAPPPHATSGTRTKSYQKPTVTPVHELTGIESTAPVTTTVTVSVVPSGADGNIPGSTPAPGDHEESTSFEGAPSMDVDVSKAAWEWISNALAFMLENVIVFVAIGVCVVLLVAGIIVLVYRRRQRRILVRGEYSSVPAEGGEEMHMADMDGEDGQRVGLLAASRSRSRVSIHDDDDQEIGGPHRTGPGGMAPGLGYHPGFLEDEDTPTTPFYRDQPAAGEGEAEEK